MKNWKRIGAGFLCAVMLLPCISASAGVTVNRGGRKDRPEDEKESSNLETTITETETEEKENVSTTVTEDIIEPADIVFVIDSTGPMVPHIENVADNIEKFSKYLEEKHVEVRMAVLEYRDITCDGADSTKIHTIDGTPWHQSTAELIETLNIIKSNVDGGGDLPETVIDALGYVADGESLKFSSAAHKFAIVLSDAPYKEENSHGLTMESLIASLNSQSINTSVITESSFFDTYKALAADGGMTADIRSENFSEELTRLADVIFKTIEKEVIDEKITSVKSVKVTCKGNNTIQSGNSVDLNAVILPADADVKKVEWVVEDDNIASIRVSKDTLTCTVTGRRAGTTAITAVSEDGGFTGNYTIKVFGSSDDPDTENSGGDTVSVEVTVDDMKVTPTRKTISRGKTFYIRVGLAEGSEYEDLAQEELQEILDESIDSITFRSSNSSIASVNAKTGKVTAKKRGRAVIKTTVVTADERSRTFKSTVYVK